MGKFFLFLITMFIFSKSFGGEIVYRKSDGYTKTGCNMNTNNLGSASSPYYLHTFSCNGAAVMYLSGSSLDNCYYSGGSDAYSLQFTSCRNFTISIPTIGAINDYARNYIKSGYSADGILDRPVIFVEGYDPNNEINPDSYYNRGLNQLIKNGRDIFIVNFYDGGASINDNAFKLQKVIEEINRVRLGNHPIAVIGYSMGGIIARKTLKNMENSGLNHQVSLYVSYDAPHLGANIPQTIMKENEKLISYIDSIAAGYTPSELSQSRKFYNSPAAKDMLLGGVSFVPANARDFPNNLTRIAVTSGAMTGAGQANPVYQGQAVASFCAGMKVVVLGVPFSFCKDLQYTTSPINGVYYDNTPGSYFTSIVNDVNYNTFDAALEKYRAGSNRFSIYSQSKGNNVTFVPTLSALAIANIPLSSPAINYMDFSPFDKFIAIDNINSAATAFYSQASSGINSDHNVFYSSQLNQLNMALDDHHKIGATIPNRSFKRY